MLETMVLKWCAKSIFFHLAHRFSTFFLIPHLLQHETV